MNILNNSVGTRSNYPSEKPSPFGLPTLKLNLDGGFKMAKKKYFTEEERKEARRNSDEKYRKIHRKELNSRARERWQIHKVKDGCDTNRTYFFKKGYTPWNKGKKGLQVPWNKGKKGLQVAWNKGMKGINKPNITSFRKEHIPWNKDGGEYSDETREKMRQGKLGKPGNRLGIKCPAMCGENHPNWKGGVSREYKTGYHSAEYKQWRKSVFERDKYTCQNCKEVGRPLNAHHIKRFNQYPELRLEINNGVTLCEECHKSIHRRR